MVWILNGYIRSEGITHKEEWYTETKDEGSQANRQDQQSNVVPR